MNTLSERDRRQISREVQLTCQPVLDHTATAGGAEAGIGGREPMHVALLFPTGTDPRSPYLALPSLAAALRDAGIRVKLHDLDIGGIHFCSSDSNWKPQAGTFGPRAIRCSIVGLSVSPNSFPISGSNTLQPCGTPPPSLTQMNGQQRERDFSTRSIFPPQRTTSVSDTASTRSDTTSPALINRA